jgi:hypothetical protein
VKRALAALLALAAAACGDQPGGDPGLVLTVAVSPTPALVGSGRILVALADAAGTPVGGATVLVTGTPPDGGAAVVDTAREQGPGSYAAPAFPFAAPGDWSLVARAQLPDSRRAEAVHAIRVVGRPSLP